MITICATPLVENARKYSEKDAPVEIVLEDRKEEICLSVKDQGIGISAKDQQKIWQRFYQVDFSRSGDECYAQHLLPVRCGMDGDGGCAEQ